MIAVRRFIKNKNGSATVRNPKGIDLLEVMMKSNGVVYNKDKTQIDIGLTVKRWIAIWFNGGTYVILGKRLTDSESEDVAYQLITLLQWLERHFGKRALEQ